MAEQIQINSAASREEHYRNLLPQMAALLSAETDIVASMANFSAVLKQVFHFLWVGFYTVKGDNLMLSPFQGKIACTRIACGKGVCGTAWKTMQPQIVPNVALFAGHIACDSESVSEIVIPIIREGKVVAVLDIDSEFENYFSEIDQYYLSQLTDMIHFN